MSILDKKDLKCRKIIKTIFSILTIVFFSGCISTHAFKSNNNVYFVSPMGSDNNPRTKARPFKTIEKARYVIRTINQDMKEDIIVNLRGGEYFLDNTICFYEDDSGNNGHKIFYKAYERELPILNGGKRVTGWNKVEGTHLWRVKVEFTDNFRHLYVNGRRAPRAVSKISYTGIGMYYNDKGDPDGIIVDESIIGDYQNKKDIELHWSPEWRDFRIPVEDIIPGNKGQKIILMRQPFYKIAMSLNNDCLPGFDKSFYIENAFELLDTPGEWYFNRTSRELFYYPDENEDMKTAQVYIPILERLIEVKGSNKNKVHHICFQGISFMYSTWMHTSENAFVSNQAENICSGELDNLGKPVRTMVSPSIFMDNASDIQFEGNRVEHVGSVGMGLLNGIESMSRGQVH